VSAVFVRSWRIGYGTWNVPATFVGVQPSGCSEDRLKAAKGRTPTLRTFIAAVPASHSHEVAHLMSDFDLLSHFGDFSAFIGFFSGSN
jgi:hypothetical protein